MFFHIQQLSLSKKKNIINNERDIYHYNPAMFKIRVVKNQLNNYI